MIYLTLEEMKRDDCKIIVVHKIHNRQAFLKTLAVETQERSDILY